MSTPKKKFRVRATMYTDLYIDVEAVDSQEAYNLARESCGGDFEEFPNSGDWEVHGTDIEQLEG